MSSVHNFILACEVGAVPPALPWPDVRWVKLDHLVVGDGKAFEGSLFALVLNGRDPHEVIKAFDAHDWSEDSSAVLLSKYQQDDYWRCASQVHRLR